MINPMISLIIKDFGKDTMKEVVVFELVCIHNEKYRKALSLGKDMARMLRKIFYRDAHRLSHLRE